MHNLYDNIEQSKKRMLLYVLFSVVVVAGFVIYARYINIGSRTQVASVLQISTLSDKIPPLRVEEVKNIMDSGRDDFIILDIRDRSDFTSNHIPGSYSVPQDELSVSFPSLPKDKKIIVTHDGNCHYALSAAQYLMQVGFTDVAELYEGITGWQIKQLPTVSGAAPVLEHIAYITPDLLELKIGIDTDFVLVDVRESFEYESGHIPGAINSTFAAVRFDYYNKKIPPAKEIVVYDRAGERAESAATELQRVGAENVKYLKGGLTAWKTQGGDLE